MNELKIRLKLGLIFFKKAWLELIRLVFHMNELELNLELKLNPEPLQVCIVINLITNTSIKEIVFYGICFTLVDLAIDAKAVKATSFNICFSFWITQNSTAETACN